MSSSGVLRGVVLFSSACLAAITVGLGLSRPEGLTGISDYLDLSDPIYSLSQFIFVAVGFAVLYRRPGHRVAWLFVIIGLVGLVGLFAYEYAVRALIVEPGSLPGGAIASWVFYLLLTPIVSWSTIVVLRYPDGELPSPQWRAVEAVALAGIAVTIAAAVWLWPHRGVTLLDETPELGGAAAALWDAPYVLMLPALFGSLASLLFRYRRSPPVERQQLKWFVFALVVAVVGVIVGPLASADGAGNELLASVGVLLLPIATGFAILRYRLFDIDRIISRTLAYGFLTALLAGSYLAAVLALQSVLPLGDDSPVIVAASTLAVVAAFGPLRSRVKDLVDRRFNRSRYDADHTVAKFGAHLRTEVELDALTAGLLTVVDRTMAPEHVSLWIKPWRPT